MDESGEFDFHGAQIKTIMYIIAHFTIWLEFRPKIDEKEILRNFKKLLKNGKCRKRLLVS